MTDERTGDELVFDRVTRRFGKRTAVVDLSFTCSPGSITCLLGANGAGKSTALSLAAGLMAPTEGRITVGGVEVSPARAPEATGFLPQRSAFASGLRATEVLELAFEARCTDPADREHVLEVTQAGLVANRPLGELSGGWVRRVDIACALVPPTRLLLLDEPFVGLDPSTLDRLEQHLRERAAQGTTVVLASHAFDVVDRLGGTIIVLDEGRIQGVAEEGEDSLTLFRRALHGEREDAA